MVFQKLVQTFLEVFVRDELLPATFCEWKFRYCLKGKILNELSLICVDEMNRRHDTQHNDIQLKDIQHIDK